jgi:glycoside/pentoside/hexuronide:cation symporter, GPH family
LFIVGTVGAVVSYLSMFLITTIATRTDKRTGLVIGLAISLVGILGSWWALDPRWPYAQVATTASTMLGMPGCWLLIGSMVADICDEDELKTGRRREGIFGAVNGFENGMTLVFAPGETHAPRPVYETAVIRCDIASGPLY